MKSRAKRITTRCWPNEVVRDATKRSIEWKAKSVPPKGHDWQHEAVTGRRVRFGPCAIWKPLWMTTILPCNIRQRRGRRAEATPGGRGCAATDAESDRMEGGAGDLLPFHRLRAHDRVDPCQACKGRRAQFRKANAGQRMTFIHVSFNPITLQTERSDHRLGLPSSAMSGPVATRSARPALRQTVLRSSQRINACRYFAWLLKADSPLQGPLLLNCTPHITDRPYSPSKETFLRQPSIIL